jgi:hypothetical protein
MQETHEADSVQVSSTVPKKKVSQLGLVGFDYEMRYQTVPNLMYTRPRFSETLKLALKLLM